MPKTKKRKPQNLTQSQTFDGGKLRKAAEIKKDETILLHIRDKDCVAIEACYHRNCYIRYTNFLNYELVKEKTLLYEESYTYFCPEVVEKRIINDKQIMFMSSLFKEFLKVVLDKEELDASNYR